MQTAVASSWSSLSLELIWNTLKIEITLRALQGTRNTKWYHCQFESKSYLDTIFWQTSIYRSGNWYWFYVSFEFSRKIVSSSIQNPKRCLRGCSPLVTCVMNCFWARTNTLHALRSQFITVVRWYQVACNAWRFHAQMLGRKFLPLVRKKRNMERNLTLKGHRTQLTQLVTAC